MSRTLNRTVLAGGVIYPAGTPATDELEDAISNPEFWSGSAAAESYDDMGVDELKAEVDRRSLDVTGTGKDGNVLKKDLVAALEADDKA